MQDINPFLDIVCEDLRLEFDEFQYPKDYLTNYTAYSINTGKFWIGYNSGMMVNLIFVVKIQKVTGISL